jgi:hypothetical protein
MCAALGGCDVGNAVKLDRAGEVARRRVTGGALMDKKSCNLLRKEFLDLFIEAGSVPEREVWIYQYRNNASKEWNSFYSFTEVEFFQDDFEVMNRFTSWDALQKGNRWVVKFLRGGEVEGFPLLEGEVVDGVDGNVVVVGKVMFVNDVVKVNLGGRTRVVDCFQTDEARAEGLKRWFSMSL